LGGSRAHAIDRKQEVLRFDAGGRDSQLDALSVGLDRSSAYTPQRGYGWTNLPTQEFRRAELSRSRTAMTIDGVAGPRLAFRADVAPGTWHVLLWVEAGRDSARQPRLSIQGMHRSTGWQDFLPSEEPRESPEKTFRVFQGIADVASDGLTVELVGVDADVRLLGMTFIRKQDAVSDPQRRLAAQIDAAGGLGNSTPLEGLLNEAVELARQQPTDAYAALWQERIALLSAAERLIAMRGWEWADEPSGMGMFDRLDQAVMLLDGLLGDDGAQADVVTDRALFQRGRLLFWLAKESEGAKSMTAAQRDFARLAPKYSKCDLLRMYMGAKIRSSGEPGRFRPTPEAPAWSNAQREVLCRMRDVVSWWVNQRQATNGEFGGKFGDDVELLRWWAPLALSGDETTRRGWQRLADGVWQSRHVKNGYASKVRDVEHASEFVSDSAPVMLALSDDIRYEQRLALSVPLFNELWTGITPQGHRFFRGAWFSSSEIDIRSPRDRDVAYTARAVRPLRYVAWRRGDSEVIKLLSEWSTAWANAAMRTDKGKPRGIIPPSVRFADEAINGDEPAWYAAHMMWDYFEWGDDVGSMMLDQLLFTYTLTHEKALLEPLTAELELIHSHETALATAKPEQLKQGTALWAADKLVRSQSFWTVVQQWRLATGDARWDDVILRRGTPYIRYRLSGDERHLIEGLDSLLGNLRYNTPLLTSEAIHTDRIYVPGWELAKSMLTGDGVMENASPYFAVTWEQTNADFTALVAEASADRLAVQAFSHSAEQCDVVMRLWQLSPGNYQMRCETVGRAESKRLSVADKGARVRIPMPAMKHVTIIVERQRGS
jgi:hypothetical protein